LVLFAVTCAGAAGFLYLRYSERRTPQGQPPLAHLAGDLARLQAEFNAAADRPRVLLMLSPTWAVCLRGASAVQKLIAESPDAALRVFVVWEPVIVTDIAPPTTGALGLLHDRRVLQFWDEDTLLSRAMLAVARASDLGERYEIPDDSGFILWDLVAYYPPGVTWTDSVPIPPYFQAPVVEHVDELGQALRGSPAVR
jgi:hypothetical protein